MSGRQSNLDVAALAKFGDAIRILRRELQISQESLAYMAEIDRSHMGKIERGERNVTFLNIAKIARALGCKPSELFAKAGL